MEDEITEAVETAEPTEAAPDVGDTSSEAVATDVAPTDEGVPGTGDASTPESPDQAQPPGPDFDWKAWSGDDFDVFPEDVRPWVQGLHSHLYARVEQRLAYVEELAKTYEGLTQGRGSPELTALREQYEALEATKQELEQAHAQALADQKAQYDALHGDYQTYQERVNAAIEADAEAYREKFEKENEDIFADEDLAKAFAEILDAEDEDWDPEDAARLARLPAPVRTTARKYAREGVPPKYALQFAEANNGQPKRRPGAAITAGAKVPARQREQAIVEKEPTNPQEVRLRAIRKNWSQAS